MMHRKSDEAAPPAPSASAAPEFQLGKIPTDAWKASFQQATVVHPMGEAEEAYIPLQLARQHLNRVVQDMHTMKTQHQAQIQAILDRYAAIEASTKGYYEQFVSEIKRRALERMQVHKQQYAQLRLEKEQEAVVARAMLDSLETSKREQQQAHLNSIAMYQSEKEMRETAHVAEITTLRRAYDQEQDRLFQQWKLADRALLESRATLYMSLEDHAGQNMRMFSALLKMEHSARIRDEQDQRERAIRLVLELLCGQVEPN
jgi:hypothetical protein